MDRYICTACGYTVDLMKGLENKKAAPNMNAMLKSGCGWHKHPENRPEAMEIAAGTKWEHVPEYFACPSCGAEKDYFESLDD